jgi:hypothetical protein
MYMAYLNLAVLLSKVYLYARSSMLPFVFSMFGQVRDQISGLTTIKIHLVCLVRLGYVRLG